MSADTDTQQIILEDLFNLITDSKRSIWPPDYSKVKKLQFVDNLIHYFAKRDDYEKCALLKKVKGGIANEQLRIKTKKDS